MSVRLATAAAVLLASLSGCSSTDRPSSDVADAPAPECLIVGPSSGAVAGGRVPQTPGSPVTTDIPPADADPAPTLPSISGVSLEHTSDHDRIAIAIAGQGRISWSLRVVDEAYARSSRELVSVAGRCTLELGIADVASTNDSAVAIERRSDPRTGRIAEVVRTPVRGYTEQILIGVWIRGARIAASYDDGSSRLLVSIR